MRGDSALVVRVLTGKWRTSTPHLTDVYEHVRAFVRRYRLKVSYQWVLQSENKDADAACTAACDAKVFLCFFSSRRLVLDAGTCVLCVRILAVTLVTRALQVLKTLWTGKRRFVR